MHKIVVPRLNSNDDSCLLREWLVAGGARVEEGEIVAIVETSKASVELACDEPGVFEPGAELDDDCPFGSVIAYVLEDEDERQSFLAAEEATDQSASDELTITKAAQKVIDRHSVSESRLKSLGKKVIKTSDVEELLGLSGETGSAPLKLSRRQAAIADAVTLSHQTIPKAFLLMKIYCDPAQKLLTRIMAEERILVGLPELLIMAVSRLCTRFPVFYGTPVADDFAPPQDANVGITFDIGNGLFVPVIRRTGSMTLREIAKTLMGFRAKALRDTFSEDDLSGGGGISRSRLTPHRMSFLWCL